MRSQLNLDCSSKYYAYGSDHPLHIGGTKNAEKYGTITPEDPDESSNAVTLQCFALQSALTLYNYSNRNISGCGIVMQFTFIICKSDNAIIKTQPKVCLESCTIQLECSYIVAVFDSKCHSNQDSP